MFATQVLPELQSNDDSEEDNNSEVVGLIIVNDKTFEVKKGETKIGRDFSLCSIVIENLTISKVHAIIESEGIDDTFIYDVGSTNQTKLKKKVLKPHCRYKLENESKLIFGNVTAKFILPPEKSLNLDIKLDKPNSANLNSVKEFEDIFDVATQVTAAQSTASTEAFIFEKHEGNFPIFKIPNVVLSDRMEKSSESLTNCFDEMPPCRLNFEKEISRTVSNNNLIEKSDIFSLKTQCQIYETSPTEENKSEAKTSSCDEILKNNELDKIKSLLNDGQDEVLCTFMSLHSPKGNGNDNSLMDVKIKTEVIDLSEVFDAPTQIQTEIIETNANYKTEEGDHIKKEDLNRDFSCKNSCKLNITSTPLSKEFKLGHSDQICGNSDSFIEHTEDDFIMTQKFNMDYLNSNKKYTRVQNDLISLSQNEVIQPYLGKTLDDFSAKEQRNINEDLILTQAFDVLEKSYHNKETKKIISESNDLSKIDFKITEIADFKDEKEGIEGKSLKRKSALLPVSPDKDVESHLSETSDFTERNNEIDFISTQIFEGTTYLSKENGILKENDSYNEEDFISTQPLQFSLINTRNSRNLQERTAEIKISSKESSPDLLGLEDTWKNQEDSIPTQKFEIPECSNLKKSLTKFTLQSDAYHSSHYESEKYDCKNESTKVTTIVDSSGDETESDLEILFDNSEKGKDRKFLEYDLKSFKTESVLENIKQHEKPGTPESDSNCSYIFELNPENRLKDNAVNDKQNRRPETEEFDSDATDCEELAVMCPKISKKVESINKTEVEENQMTLSLPHDLAEKTSCSNDDWMNDKGSPKFEIRRETSPLSPLSLEMPNTQEIETTINSLLQNKSEKKIDFQNPVKIMKNEVRIKNLDGNTTDNEIDLTEKHIDSLLKRPLDSNVVDAVPLKKPKNEILDRLPKSSDKQFSKLVEAHDLEQIQPSRTRNSMKVLPTGSSLNNADKSLGSYMTNERPTSRRKNDGRRRRSIKQLNGDIIPCLTTNKVGSRRSSCAGRKKEIFPKESKVELKSNEGHIRILRSSKRYNGLPISSLLTESAAGMWKSKRNSRNNSEEYFNSSCINIVFTGFECKSLDKIICDLGGRKTNDLSVGEVVVADKVRRTVKFLCAIGLSLPITSPQWLLSCKNKKKFLNPWNFILKDEESEVKWDFELRTSLEKSRKVKLLHGFNVYATKSTKPPTKDLLAIVECCGGTPISSPPDVWPKNTIIVTCLEDQKWWPLAKFRNVKVVHYEFILSGVLKQKIDFKTYRLR